MSRRSSLLSRLYSGLMLAATVLPLAATHAQTPTPVPFTVGEVLVYRATYIGLSAGTGRMQVESIDTVRGRPAYHVVFTMKGCITFFCIDDRYESWLDTETLSSLRHLQKISETFYKRQTTYEIYPDRREYQKNSEPIEKSVSNPLDDLAFFYAVRVGPVKAGETRNDNRYFRPEKNPVVLTGLSTDTLSVGAGTFATTAVRPTIKTEGLFAEAKDARIWFSNDANQYPIQVQTKFAKFTVRLTLESVGHGEANSASPRTSRPKPPTP